VATGIQEKFSWKAVALSAIAGGVGAAGVGGASLGISNPTLQAMARGAVSSALTQGIGVITGLQDKFSWAGVAAAGVGAGVGRFVAGTKLAGAIGARSALAGDIFISGADAIGNAATLSLIQGSDFGDNIAAALPDVIGGAIGRRIGGGVLGALSAKTQPSSAFSNEQLASSSRNFINSLNDGVPLTAAEAARLDDFNAALPNQLAKAQSLGNSRNEADRRAGAAIAQDIREGISSFVTTQSGQRRLAEAQAFIIGGQKGVEERRAAIAKGIDLVTVTPPQPWGAGLGLLDRPFFELGGIQKNIAAATSSWLARNPVAADALQFASIGLMIANPVGAIQGIVGNAVGSNAEKNIAAFYTKRGFIYSGPTNTAAGARFASELALGGIGAFGVGGIGRALRGDAAERATATGFRGSKGFELVQPDFQPIRNVRGEVNGRAYSGHAFDQMQNRGLMPSVIDNTIETGTIFPTKAGTTGYYDPVNNVKVIVNSSTGRVVTTIRGKP
jgi:hypothetical protein